MADTGGAVRLFVPDSCTQGGELACHATWKGDGVARIDVSAPEDTLPLKACFNAAHRPGPDGLALDAFEVPGYVGLVFQARILPEPREALQVTFTIRYSSGEAETRRFEVVVFRPRVEAWLEPAGRDGPLRSRLRARNQGFGTSLVKLLADGSEGVRVEQPPELREFLERLGAAFKATLPRLVGLHPLLAPLLDTYGDLLTHELDLMDREQLRRARGFMAAFARAAREDKGLRPDWLDAVGGAVDKAAEGIGPFDPEVEYLRSLADGNLLLLNPHHVLVVPPGPQEVRLYLAMTDRSCNRYPPLDLGRVAVDSQGLRIPVHALFRAGGGR